MVEEEQKHQSEEEEKKDTFQEEDVDDSIQVDKKLNVRALAKGSLSATVGKEVIRRLIHGQSPLVDTSGHPQSSHILQGASCGNAGFH